MAKESWLQRRAPGLHRFLTRDDGQWPLLREAGGVVLLIAVLVLALWGLTGQPFGHRPVVVVESGSMMHCDNGVGTQSRFCETDRYGRFGTIDPGDLIFVRDTDRPGDVETAAEDQRARYGAPGDVVVFRPGGSSGRTPVIHRALFWLEVHPGEGEPRYSVPELDLTFVTRDQLESDPRIQALTGPSSFAYVDNSCVGPDTSGFITRGDNNRAMDQDATSTLGCPVRPEWVLGVARGEVPWIGLVNLKFNDVLSKPPAKTTNYADAPSDVKSLMWVSVLLVVAGPVLIDLVRKRTPPRGPDDEGPPVDGA